MPPRGPMISLFATYVVYLIFLHVTYIFLLIVIVKIKRNGTYIFGLLSSGYVFLGIFFVLSSIFLFGLLLAMALPFYPTPAITYLSQLSKRPKSPLSLISRPTPLGHRHNCPWTKAAATAAAPPPPLTGTKVRSTPPFARTCQTSENCSNNRLIAFVSPRHWRF